MKLAYILLGDPMAPILIGAGIGLVIGITVMIFYLLTLQKTLNEVDPKNRTMDPGQVWLNLIPIFGLVWSFITVSRIADSLKAEFSERNIPCQEDRPGYQIGLVYCICFAAGWIPFLGGLASLGGLVCWIIYWVKINGYKDELIRSKMSGATI